MDRRDFIAKGLSSLVVSTCSYARRVPTPAGLQLFELVRGAAPMLVDPATTAVWEMRLDDVMVGRADFRAVIDEIAGEADRLIGIAAPQRRHRRLELMGAAVYPQACGAQ